VSCPTRIPEGIADITLFAVSFIEKVLIFFSDSFAKPLLLRLSNADFSSASKLSLSPFASLSNNFSSGVSVSNKFLP